MLFFFFFPLYISYLGSVQQKSSFFTCISSLTHVPLRSHKQLLWQRLRCFHQEKCSWNYTLGSAFPIAETTFDCGAHPCFIACEDDKGDRCVSKISQCIRSQSVSFLSSLRLQLFLLEWRYFFSAKISTAIFIIFKNFLYNHFRYPSQLLRNKVRKYSNHKYF